MPLLTTENNTLIALSVIACIFDFVTGGGSEQIEANSSLKDESCGVRPVWPAIEADLDTLNYVIFRFI